VLLVHRKGEGMRLYRTVCLLIPILTCLAQVVFAQCHETPLTEEQRELEERSVVLILELHRSGSVHEAKVLRGPEALVPAAIKAAKARKYKHRIVYIFPDPDEMMVQVTFPQDRNGPPDVRQALPGGVSSCLPPGELRIVGPIVPTWLKLLLTVQPIMPVLAPQATN